MNIGQVSILMPAYNAEKTILRAVNSLLEQSYENVEIIVVDDCSTDNTLKILSQIEDKRLKVIPSEKIGVAKARNITLANANGEFIAFCDSDDFYEKDYISSQIEFFKNKKVCMTACNYSMKIKVVKKYRKQKLTTLNVGKAIEEIFSDKFLFIYLWNKIFRAEYLKNIEFDASFSWGEDVIFLWDYLRSCPKDSVVVHVNKKLYHYILHKGSFASLQCGKKFKKERLSFLDACENMKEVALKDMNNESLAYLIDSWQLWIIMQFLIETKFSKEHKELHKNLKLRAKEKYKSFKKVKNRYNFIRRQAWVFGLL